VVYDRLSRRIDDVRDGPLVTGLLQAIPFGWEEKGCGGITGHIL
jgi:hypothetical protein